MTSPFSRRIVLAVTTVITFCGAPYLAVADDANDLIAADTLPDTATVDPSQAARDSLTATIQKVSSLLREYIDLVNLDNIASAEQYWSPDAAERASRFGISYDGVRIKADLNSPIIKDPGHKMPLSIRSASQMDSEYIAIKASLWFDGRDNFYTYYFGKRNGFWWLIFTQDYVARDWPTRQSKYFRVHMAPGREKYVTSTSLASLDQFVDSAGTFLGLTAPQLSVLEKGKIEYYYCLDDQQVRQIAGVEVKGLHDLASDALICAAFPHPHEVAHLLINYRLKTLPITTLPLFREGLATYLGGRAGRSGASLMELAAQMLRMDMLTLDSLFELSQFHTEFDAGISYPSAALFVNYLVENFGITTVLDMYRAVSGSFEQTGSLTVAQTQNALSHLAKKPWPQIAADFNAYFTQAAYKKDPRFTHITTGFGEMKSAPTDSVVTDVAVLYRNGDRVFVKGLPHGDGNPPAGTIFFSSDSTLIGTRNELFEEQFGQDAVYNGYRYAIRFDASEAGVYDYGMSALVAKLINSMEPSDQYRDTTNATILFNFPISITHGASPTNGPKTLTQ